MFMYEFLKLHTNTQLFYGSGLFWDNLGEPVPDKTFRFLKLQFTQ